MDSVQLMDRMDAKYVFHISKLPELLQLLKPGYTVLEVEGHRLNPYRTQYFDTDDFEMYHLHLHGKSNRNKVRLRTYESTENHFFELKHKNNKGLTEKKRIRCHDVISDISGKAGDFLESRTHYTGDKLTPKLLVNYSRITLVNKNFSERITIDLNLKYQFEDKEKSLPDIVIAELKYNKDQHSDFIMLMRQEHIRPASFSKYCMGIIFLYPGIKNNRFKPQLHQLNKIRHSHD